MTHRTLLSADIDVTVSPPTGTDGPAERPFTGHLRGQDSDLRLTVSDLPLLASTFGRRHEATAMASTLSERGITLTITDPTGPVITLGAIRSPWFQRLLTGSPHIRVRALRALRILLRSGRRRQGSTTVRDYVPVRPPLPLPVLPPAPNFVHPRRRPGTTTHDPGHGGDPRLLFLPGSSPWPGEQQRAFYLRSPVTTIGSHPYADLCLDGLDPWHAEIRHDANDEFVLVLGTGVRPGEGGDSGARILRTGSRIELGQWTMSYFREEYADHGRPYGGRLGGELSHQRPQPPRQRTRDTGSDSPHEERDDAR